MQDLLAAYIFVYTIDKLLFIVKDYAHKLSGRTKKENYTDQLYRKAHVWFGI